MSNIFNRMQGSTPKFFKILRNIGLALAAISVVMFAFPGLTGYLAVAGSVMGAVSQLAVLNEDE